MGTEILKSFGTLQSELEQAKNSLRGVDENIKRLIGRDPSELPSRTNSGIKRGSTINDNRQRNRNRNFNHENDEPPNKRRNNSSHNNNNSGVSVFKRLSERPIQQQQQHFEQQQNQYDDDLLSQQPQKQMISKVIVTPKELPSRQEALAAQNKDEQSKARNRRMFGALLGTLQKFQQEETKLKQKEEKRAQLEKKIEEHEIKEKEEIKKERQELFFNRKKKQAEIRMIELKMMRMKEYAAWEERQKPRMNFIQTKTKPHIHYLPRKLNDASKTLLEACRSDIEKMIDKKRQEVFEELQHIEERMKRNFELRKSKDGKEEQENDNTYNDNNNNNEETVTGGNIVTALDDDDVDMLDVDETKTNRLDEKPKVDVDVDDDKLTKTTVDDDGGSNNKKTDEIVRETTNDTANDGNIDENIMEHDQNSQVVADSATDDVSGKDIDCNGTNNIQNDSESV